jgi:uncharacterized protein YjiS (DUF1127 family)
MLTHERPYHSAAALLKVDAILRAANGFVRAMADEVSAWLEKRRLAAAAFHDFESMSERDLRDIGLSRADVNRVAWGASDRNRDPT